MDKRKRGLPLDNSGEPFFALQAELPVNHERPTVEGALMFLQNGNAALKEITKIADSVRFKAGGMSAKTFQRLYGG